MGRPAVAMASLSATSRSTLSYVIGRLMISTTLPYAVPVKS